MLRRPRVAWLIAGLVPVGGFVVVSGRPGSGKTFLMLDLALHVAAGRSWHGRAVTQGTVVYVAAEAQGSIPQRLHAWVQYHQVRPERFSCVPETVLVGSAELDELVKALRTLPEPPVLVVFDTLSWCLGGADENASESMAAILNATRVLHGTFGAAVVWVHHPSAAGKPLRGHTSLHGATDVELFVAQPKPGTVVVKSEKVKDGPEAAPFALALRPFASDDGRPLSCIILPGDGVEDVPAPKLTRSEQHALEVLAGFAHDGATFTTWWHAAGGSKSSFKTAIATLTRGHLVEHDGGRRGGRYSLNGHSPAEGPVGPVKGQKGLSAQGRSRAEGATHLRVWPFGPSAGLRTDAPDGGDLGPVEDPPDIDLFKLFPPDDDEKPGAADEGGNGPADDPLGSSLVGSGVPQWTSSAAQTCGRCGGRRWWRDPLTGDRCMSCDPPPDPSDG
jgi:hypothetical protein